MTILAGGSHPKLKAPSNLLNTKPWKSGAIFFWQWWSKKIRWIISTTTFQVVTHCWHLITMFTTFCQSELLIAACFRTSPPRKLWPSWDFVRRLGSYTHRIQAVGGRCPRYGVVVVVMLSQNCSTSCHCDPGNEKYQGCGKGRSNNRKIAGSRGLMPSRFLAHSKMLVLPTFCEFSGVVDGCRSLWKITIVIPY